MAYEGVIRFLNKVCEVLAVGLLACLATVVFVQVLLRNLFSVGPAWMEEISRSLHMIMVFIALPILTRENLHVKIDFLLDRLPRRTQDFFRVAIMVMTLGFGGIFLASCVDLMKRTGNVKMPALNVSSMVIYVPIAVGMTILLLTLAGMIFIQLKKMKTGAEKS